MVDPKGSIGLVAFAKLDV